MIKDLFTFVCIAITLLLLNGINGCGNVNNSTNIDNDKLSIIEGEDGNIKFTITDTNFYDTMHENSKYRHPDFDTTFTSCGITNVLFKNDGEGSRFMLMVSKPTDPKYLHGMDLIDGVMLYQSHKGNRAFTVFISHGIDPEPIVRVLLDYVDMQLCQVHQRIL
jgi:hypothetical protein